jgi:hypothetical protein
MTEQDKLERLWEAYRRATPAPEPSVNFVPELWARIEATRPVNWVNHLQRLMARLAPVVAVLILMGLYWWRPALSVGEGLPTGYVEVLAADLIDQQKPPLWIGGEDTI